MQLVLLPIPDKAQLQPSQLSRFDESIAPLNNPDFQRFVAELRAHGVEVIDVLPPTIAPADRRFLVQDTHWTPEWMDHVARQVAERLRSEAATKSVKQPEQVTRLGDLVDMLRLPAGQTLFHPQTVTVERIVESPGKPADILVLGDSFSNIYSSDQMGWGDSAGFVEHLAFHLGRPVDRLVRNDAGAHATREMLAKEFQRGHDRLAGKKVVIWEFAARELACGDWRMIPLTLGTKREVGMYTPSAGKVVEVRGVVRAASPAPRPGTVPYKDHIVMVHLTELESSEDPTAAGKEAVAFVWSMRDNVATKAARYRAGDQVRLRLRRWADVAAKYEAINRSELDDEAVLLAEPNWGEVLP